MKTRRQYIFFNRITSETAAEIFPNIAHESDKCRNGFGDLSRRCAADVYLSLKNFPETAQINLVVLYRNMIPIAHYRHYKDINNGREDLSGAQ